ncbi:MAG TPA: hypothetical protein VE133_19585 [Candidatus Sulfotelmatobacter sp.]|nr:hypothetical protein [Candidatus Sulfotelmatobacter sp.]
MPENPNPIPPPPTPPKAGAAPSPRADAGHIPITEELDSAKWTLPPIVPLLVGGVLIAIVVTVIVLSNRTKPSAALAMTKVASVDQQGNTMVAIQVKLDNQIAKPLWIKNIIAEVETPDGRKYTDSAAPSMDAARYMEAFPLLQEAKADWLKEELKIPTKTSFNGVAIFSFPVAKDAFDARKTLRLRIQLYDNPTLVVVSPAPAK